MKPLLSNKQMRIVLFFLAIIFTTSLHAQVPTISEAQAKKELEKRGLEEDLVRTKLLERGIDIDNIDSSNPQEVIRLQNALEAITQEIERENKEELNQNQNEIVEETVDRVERQSENIISQEVKEIASETTAEINDAVEDGATIQEAIAEGIIDSQNEEKLPPTVIFGQHIFRDKKISDARFGIGEQRIIPDSYILDSGDKLTISIWGISELDVSKEINPDGYIKLDDIPRINLKGIPFGKAREIIYSRLKNYYRFGKNEFEVTVAYSRTITVHVVGEVINPGSFTMPALNTVFNALVAANGPSDIGSVRNIKRIRGGTPNKQIDIYEYLLDPSINEDYNLQDNDVIHVDVAEKVVSIRGAVRRPFRYELKKNERLKDLVKYSGGLKNNAYQGNLQVKRYVDDLEKIIDVNYRATSGAGKNFQLNGGDDIIVGVIPKPYQNFVEIIGSVDLPGKYELESGMRLKDLMSKGKLSQVAKLDVAYLFRTNADNTLDYTKINLNEVLESNSIDNNIILQPKDKLVVFGKDKFKDNLEVYTNGAVRVPSSFAYENSETLKIEDVIILSGGLRKDAIGFGYIHRTPDPKNPKEKEYIRVDIQNALANPSSADNVKLEPNDRLEVFSKLTYTDDINIGVRGAVRQPGEYPYHESLKLRDALTLSGGLKITASRKKIDIYRMILNEENDNGSKIIVASISVDGDEKIPTDNDFKLEPFDEIVVRSIAGFKYQQYVSLEGEVKYPGEYALLDNNERLSSIVKRAGGVTMEAFPEGATLYREEEGVGFVVLRLDEVLKNEKDVHNFILKKGDVINIPKQKDLVTITGATRARELYTDEILKGGKFNVAFNSGKRAKWYVDEYAAGVGVKGKSKLITVEHPNGKIEKTKNFLLFQVHPKVRRGSIVKVGAKPVKPVDPNAKPKEPVDWGRVLADSVAQATAILSLILLLERVN